MENPGDSSGTDRISSCFQAWIRFSPLYEAPSSSVPPLSQRSAATSISSVSPLKKTPAPSTKCVSLTANRGELVVPRPEGYNRLSDKTFLFENIFDDTDNQADVCDSLDDRISAVVGGANTTIIAYGPVNSGKTYTMFGNDKSGGIFHSANSKIFQLVDSISEHQWNIFFVVEISFVELHNNKFVNLLKDSPGDNLLPHEFTGLEQRLFANESSNAELSQEDSDNSADLSAVHPIDKIDSKGFPMLYSKYPQKAETIEVHEHEKYGCFLVGNKLRVGVATVEEAQKAFSRGIARRCSQKTVCGDKIHYSSR
jgi:hypothetical protein